MTYTPIEPRPCRCQNTSGVAWLLILLLPSIGVAADLRIPAGTTFIADGNVVTDAHEFNALRDDTLTAHEMRIGPDLLQYTRLDVHGTLELRNTRLKVQTLIVHAGGKLVLHEPCSIVFRNLPLDPAIQHGSNGLLVMGEISTQGVPDRTSHVRLKHAASVGDDILWLSSPVQGWKVGDQLFVPDSRDVSRKQFLRTGSHSEYVTIAEVREDAVRLSEPLKYDHPASYGGEYRPYVAHVTRGIVLQSENPDGVRGHVMAMGNAKVHLKGVEFRDLGRTTVQPVNPRRNPIGRYSCHLHLLGRTDAALEQCLVRNREQDRQRWGVNVHGSDGTTVRNCVSIGPDGVGFNFAEEPPSRNCVIEDNFAAKSIGENDQVYTDRGRWGAGFWTGARNTFRRNVSNECHIGFAVVHPGGGEIRPNRPNPPIAIPESLGTFEACEYFGPGNNTAFAFWRVGVSGLKGKEQVVPDLGWSLIRNCRAWNGGSQHSALEIRHCAKLRVQNFVGLTSHRWGLKTSIRAARRRKPNKKPAPNFDIVLDGCRFEGQQTRYEYLDGVTVE